jgi:hypothetical protein
VQGGDRADVRRLLAGGQMAVPADLGRLVLALGLGLEGADQQHQLKQAPETRSVHVRLVAVTGVLGLRDAACHDDPVGMLGRP